MEPLVVMPLLVMKLLLVAKLFCLGRDGVGLQIGAAGFVSKSGSVSFSLVG
jgi:hypothetical protein